MLAAIAVTTAATAVPLGLTAAHAAWPTAERPGQAADGTNSRPAVIPALQEWTGGRGTHRISAASRVVTGGTGAKDLLPLARRITEEIAEITGVRLAAPRTITGAPRGGEILLRRDPGARHERGQERYEEEGYSLEVTEGTVTVTAPAYSGVYYGTRSLLQILLQDDERSRLPVGTAEDWPNYRLRGFMLDVGRRYFTPGFIRDYLGFMGWFKLNDLQLHLNDNEIHAPEGDWSRAYDAFRLRSEKPEWDGLAAEDGSYSRADWDSFEDTAARHAVQLTPEIDAPAHARSFVRFRPDLGLNGGNSDHLDLENPETTAFVKKVFDEFTPWFRSPEVHYGADEYTGAEELYRGFFNTMAEHLRSLGKHPRAWGSLTHMAGGAGGYDRDVTIHSWNNGWYGPQAAKADGYEIVNTNDSLLYIVPFADYYHGHGLDGRYLYGSWEPHVFPGNQSLQPGDPQLRGAMSAVWNDLVHATYTQQDVHGLVQKTFGILAQKMWSGAAAQMPYADFTTALRRAADGPGMTTIRPTLPEPDDLAFQVKATASSKTAGTSAAHATDGDPLTRWTSDRENGPWLAVDLGEPHEIARVSLDWSGDHGRAYDIEVSDDGRTWRTVVSRDDRDRPGRDELTFPATTVRHVRLKGREGKKIRYGLWSLQVLAAPDLARDKKITASSSETSGLVPENANDGDPTTRWASQYTDDQWLAVDLGGTHRVRRVVLDWEAAAGRDYDIQISADGTVWTTVVERRGRQEAGVDTVDFTEPRDAAHVRMKGLARQTDYGYSLWTFEVHA
ncbi:discoidin domain-containing protein [Streptomyces sp. B8F3]|uniref:discoidin domain-containing protein n=1 Tax=Streptomyces sp. B8F3 TaxID=3153573 RepID=UPI00325CB185